MLSPLCIARAVRDTLIFFLRTGTYVGFTGHRSLVLNDAQPENIQVLKCTVCGKTTVLWIWPENISPSWMEQKGLQYKGPYRLVDRKGQSSYSDN